MLKIVIAYLVFQMINNTVGKHIFSYLNGLENGSLAFIGIVIAIEMAVSYGIVSIGASLYDYIDLNRYRNRKSEEQKQTEQEAVRQSGNVCIKCGAPLQEGAYFCRRCGTTVQPADPVETVPELSEKPSAETSEETAEESVEESAVEKPVVEPEVSVEEPAATAEEVVEEAAEESVQSVTEPDPAPATAVDRKEAVCSVPVEPKPQPESGEERRVLFCQFCGGVLHPLTGECLNCHARVDLIKPVMASSVQAKPDPVAPVTPVVPVAPEPPVKKKTSCRGRVWLWIGSAALLVSMVANAWLGIELSHLYGEKRVLDSYAKAISVVKNTAHLGYKEYYFTAERSVIVRELDAASAEFSVICHDYSTFKYAKVSSSDTSILEVYKRQGDYPTMEVKIKPKKKGAAVVTISDGSINCKVLVVII